MCAMQSCTQRAMVKLGLLGPTRHPFSELLQESTPVHAQLQASKCSFQACTSENYMHRELGLPEGPCPHSQQLAVSAQCTADAAALSAGLMHFWMLCHPSCRSNLKVWSFRQRHSAWQCSLGRWVYCHELSQQHRQGRGWESCNGTQNCLRLHNVQLQGFKQICALPFQKWVALQFMAGVDAQYQ